MSEIVKIKSISQVHEILGYEKPKHPLVSLLDISKTDFTGIPPGTPITTDLYSIWLKDSNCAFSYGRHDIDFNEGVLVFTAPGQVMSSSIDHEPNGTGWVLMFHPDLIRRSALGQTIDDYTFFSYENYEALHLSEDEEKTITDCALKIQDEYEQRIDNHSQKVIVAGLDLLLSYCGRYYERQFNTRTNQNKDIISQIEKLLKDYYKTSQALEYGSPSINYLADNVHLSPGYLSDLLKKETGRSGKDHINDFLVDRGKMMLLNSNDTINEIAYALGFNYPHYFSRLFKQKTGMSPQQFRDN